MGQSEGRTNGKESRREKATKIARQKKTPRETNESRRMLAAKPRIVSERLSKKSQKTTAPEGEKSLNPNSDGTKNGVTKLQGRTLKENAGETKTRYWLERKV